jgi:hypothetical protein
MRPLLLGLLAVLATEHLLQAQNIQMASWSQLLADGGRVSWSVNNKIAYDHQGSDGYFNVYTILPNGSGSTCLTCSGAPGASALPGLNMGNPIWSPDGNFIIFEAQMVPLGGDLADIVDFPGSGWQNDLWATDTNGHFWQLTHTSDYLSAGGSYSSGGSGCTNGTQMVTFSGGGATTNATGTIGVSGGVPTGAITLTTGGAGYTSAPTTVQVATCTGTTTIAGATQNAISGVIYPAFSWNSGLLAWGQRTSLLPSPPTSPYGTWELAVGTFTETGGVPAVSSINYYSPGANNYYYEPHGFSLDNSTVFFMGSLTPGMATYAMNIYSLNLNTGALANLTNSLVNWNEYPEPLPSSFGSNKLIYMLYGRPSTTGSCVADYWVMNYDGTDNYQLTFFNTPGNPNYMGGVCMDDSRWNASGSQLVAFSNNFAANGHTGQPGPIWILNIGDVAAVNAVSSGAFPGSGFYPGSGLQ